MSLSSKLIKTQCQCGLISFISLELIIYAVSYYLSLKDKVRSKPLLKHQKTVCQQQCADSATFTPGGIKQTTILIISIQYHRQHHTLKPHAFSVCIIKYS